VYYSFCSLLAVEAAFLVHAIALESGDEHASGGHGIYTEVSMSIDADTVLARILATTRTTVAASRAQVSVEELEQRAEQHQPRGWASALRARAATAPAIIAELKKASPSKGLIREDFDVEWLARRYATGGATVLSVLTDEPYFQGSLRNLELASAAVPIPCLRKDFTVDEYQILEARAYSGDAILLIAAALTDAEMLRFTRAAHSLELDVLCEVHTGEELDRVLSLAESPDAIGVNNRDLRTFEVNLATSLKLVERIPATVVRVAESGISTSADLALLRSAGFDAFLIGESLMRQVDPAAALHALLAGSKIPTVNSVGSGLVQ
jgi:indole-3-glycerol phosphate synthase